MGTPYIRPGMKILKGTNALAYLAQSYICQQDKSLPDLKAKVLALRLNLNKLNWNKTVLLETNALAYLAQSNI